MTINTPQEFLLAVADLFDEVEWVQGQLIRYDNFTDEPVGCCILGGARLVYEREIQADNSSQKARVRARDLRAEAVRLLYWKMGSFDPRPDHLPEWNDTPGRTKAEVQALLREAARS